HFEDAQGRLFPHDDSFLLGRRGTRGRKKGERLREEHVIPLTPETRDWHLLRVGVSQVEGLAELPVVESTLPVLEGRDGVAVQVPLPTEAGASVGSSRESPPATANGASITATPNPVPAGTGLGSTMINWTTGDGSVGDVYFSMNGGSSQLWAVAPSGSQRAPWLGDGSMYEFRLCAHKHKSRVLATVRVQRSRR